MMPTEDQEQATFVSYLRLKGYPHFHVPNSTYTKSFSQKRKNSRLGVSPGVPDLFIIDSNGMCAIEMKRSKGGVVSSYQKTWIETLNKCGIETAVCHGAKEAIAFIEGRLKRLV